VLIKRVAGDGRGKQAKGSSFCRQKSSMKLFLKTVIY